ncbi:hypothetical protein MY4824_007875 [Beauveria thailandica]
MAAVDKHVGSFTIYNQLPGSMKRGIRDPLKEFKEVKSP